MSCFGHEACEILAPRAGIKPIPLYGKAKSQPLDHQGSPDRSPSKGLGKAFIKETVQDGLEFLGAEGQIPLYFRAGYDQPR